MKNQKRITFANKMHVISKYGFIKEITDADEIYFLNLEYGEKYAKKSKDQFIKIIERGGSYFVYYSFRGKHLVSHFSSKRGFDGFKSFVDNVAYLEAESVPTGL